MDNLEESNGNAATLPNPVSVKPKTNSPADTVLEGLIIGCLMSVLVFGVILSLTPNPNAWFIGAVPAVLFTWSHWVQTRRRERRAAFMDAYVFPATVKERTGRHYPHLSDDELSLMMQGLRQYFQLCNDAGSKTVSMPSRVVDVAWHEFILFTHAYGHFCQQGIGRFLHHTPAEGMVSAATLEEGMKRAWHLACEREGINQTSPSRLPFLFAIDAALNIPDGFHHPLKNDYATSSSASCGGGGCGGCGGC